jgi:hypothetical protein
LKLEHISENYHERHRLNSIAASLKDADLHRRLNNGLTLEAVFVHMAFWDDYATALLKDWERSGFTPSRTNFEAVNAAVRNLALAVPDRLGVELAQSAAEAVDRQVEALSSDLAAEIEAAGYSRILRRAEHRREHLDQIEKVLAGGSV